MEIWIYNQYTYQRQIVAARDESVADEFDERRREIREVVEQGRTVSA